MNIAVLGAGSVGLILAAELSHAGHHVNLWNRTESNINEIIKYRKIKVNGKKSYETYVYRASSKIDEIINDVQIVFVTVPSNSHKDIAELSAPFLHEDMLVVLIPGATLGVFEFTETLQNANVKLPIVAETLTSLYTCRKNGASRVTLIEIKEYDLISTIDASLNPKVISLFPECLKSYFKPATSILATSLGNVNMVLHCIPSLLNAGRIEDPDSEFLFYTDGITPSIAALIEMLDSERLAVASKLGIILESISDWFRRSYNVDGDNLYEIIQNNDAYLNVYAQNTLDHRYLTEDVATGLVPLEHIGNKIGIDLPVTKLLIDLSEKLLHLNFRKKGRVFSEKTLIKIISTSLIHN